MYWDTFNRSFERLACRRRDNSFQNCWIQMWCTLFCMIHTAITSYRPHSIALKRINSSSYCFLPLTSKRMWRWHCRTLAIWDDASHSEQDTPPRAWQKDSRKDRELLTTTSTTTLHSVPDVYAVIQRDAVYQWTKYRSLLSTARSTTQRVFVTQHGASLPHCFPQQLQTCHI